jgi:6-phosphofructokinase
MHLGVLTGGGDCPGLNAVIRGATLALLGAGARVSGIERGFWGLMHDRIRPLAAADVHELLDEGGTLLGTHNRADPATAWTRCWPSAATARWPSPPACTRWACR